jgi:hypothetical protein
LDDNCVEDENRMRTGNLGTARPIEPEPDTYERLLVFVAQRFRIADMSRVSLPPWRGDLFSV